MVRYLYILVFVLAGWQQICATPSYTREDSLFVCRVLSEAKSSGETSTLYFANRFINQPYVAHTLEVFDDERLVVNTRELDCTTLVENVLALTLCARHGKTSFKDFLHYLQSLRYRGGVIDGYPSRLHYFSDWILDNERMGFVTEVTTSDLPASIIQQSTLSINYMSQHPDAYKALKATPSLISIIRSQELKLTGLKFCYIPKSQVIKVNTKALRSVIKDGDVIAMTTNMKGLDISHLGFALWKSDGLHFLNASMRHKKVEVEPRLFREYIQTRTSCTGIRVVRLK